MANLARITRGPLCLFCRRRLANYDIPDVAMPFLRQLRGKKKVRKQPVMLNVKLLEDIPGYGKEGSVIPVAPGRMRNILYPFQKAAYVSKEQLRDLKRQEYPIERDYTYGMEKPGDVEESSAEGDERSLLNVQMDLLSPQKATEIISSTLPPILRFFRTPISNPEPSASPRETVTTPSGSSNSPSAEDAAASSKLLPRAHSVAIFGSVSAADIAEEAKALLRTSEEGERIVLGAEDITIIRSEGEGAVEESDRLKVLGNFAVDIQVKGGEAVRRVVRIMGQ